MQQRFRYAAAGPLVTKGHVMTASVTVTERAAKRIAQIVSNEPENNMLRVSVEGGGCSGFEYRFDLVPNAEPQDILIERAGCRMNAFSDSHCNRRADNVVMIADSWR